MDIDTDISNFMAWAKPRRAKNTLGAYEIDLRQLRNYMMGRDILDTEGITTPIVEDFITTLGTSLSRHSLNRKLGTLSIMFKFLVRQKVITVNPCTDVERLKASRRQPVPLTREEMSALHAHADTLISRLILCLGLQTGLRRAEITDLRLESIDSIKLEMRVLGKGSVERTVLITEELASLIQEYAQGRTTGPLFIRPNGEPMTSRQIYHRLRKLAKRAGVHRLHPHLLRHTFASYMLEGGATLTEVQVLLGHASAATTSQYVHPTQGQKERYMIAVRRLMP